ncbi:MAG: hypothetical protein LC772_01095, partial [Chloroflexi bacterium]|nr:hypothetical protein [Chloroflexota bacterium]
GYGTGGKGEITLGHPYFVLDVPFPMTIWFVGYTKTRRDELFSLITRRAGLHHDSASDVWRAAPTRQALPPQSARRPAIAVRWSQLAAPARCAFEAAEQYARESGPTLVTPEHLLAGLAASPDSKIANLLGEQSIDRSAILATIISPTRSDGAPPADPVGLSVRLKEVLLLAAEQAGKNKIAPEQLLLAIARQRGGAASDLLLAHGLGPVRLRRRLERFHPILPAV